MGNNVETKCPAKEMLHTHSFIAQPIKLTPRNCRKYIKPEDRRKDFVKLLGPKPRKKSGSHIAASHSRQPLVTGERLVCNEVNAVMPHGFPWMRSKYVCEMLAPLFAPCQLCNKRKGLLSAGGHGA